MRAAAPFKSVVEDAALAEVFGTFEVFVEETPDDLRILKEQINTADFENAGLTAHKIKSSYRTLGMTKISGLLQKIELAAKNEEKIDKIKNKWLPELIPMLDSSMEEVKDYLKNK